MLIGFSTEWQIMFVITFLSIFLFGFIPGFYLTLFLLLKKSKIKTSISLFISLFPGLLLSGLSFIAIFNPWSLPTHGDNLYYKFFINSLPIVVCLEILTNQT